MNPSASNIKLWSKFGPRAVYGMAMHNLAKDKPNLVAISGDLGNSSGLDRFKRDYPDQYLNAGIAEQNMIGFAAGVSRNFYNVFVSSFAPFLTMRAAEQVRMNLGYMSANVKLVGIGSGLSMGFLGNSHYGLEDISIMRAIPGLAIVSPADCFELVKVVEFASEYTGPMYIRLTGAPDNPIVYNEDYDFDFGKAVWLKEGCDICLIATGSMVAHSMVAANLISQCGISCSVVNMHTISPIDSEALDKAFDNHSLVVTIEEHFLSGGLGTLVAEYRAIKNISCKHSLIGLPNCYGVTAEYDYLLNYYGLVGSQIAEKIKSIFV